MKQTIRCLAIAAGLVFATANWAADDKAKGAEMARVAIIKYQDKTGTKNFEYMPGSLQEAITKSMHTKFEFVEVEADKVEPIVAQVRAKNKGIITPKEAAEICRLADIDILIYGNFTFNKAENEIEIHTEISLGSTDKYRTMQPTENRVDATIFQAADKVAGEIVGEITKVALEQQQAKGKAALDKKKKTQLDKVEKSKTWADINWVFQLSGGVSIPLISQDKATVKKDGTPSFEAYRRIKGPIHLGILGSFMSVKTNSQVTPISTNLDLIDAAIMLGYFWDLSARWRLTGAIGAGYYYGFFDSYNTCGNTNCSSGSYSGESFRVKNPLFTARVGVDFLLFSFVSLGLYGDWRMHYDSPKSIHSTSAGLRFAIVF